MATRKQTPAISKSEQMRKMFVAGKTVNDVARELGVPYSFAYGVAARAVTAGVIKSIPAEARTEQAPAKKAKATKPAAATRKPAAKKKVGRPTTKRRTANRKAS